MIKEGYIRARIDGQIVLLEEIDLLEKIKSTTSIS